METADKTGLAGRVRDNPEYALAASISKTTTQGDAGVVGRQSVGRIEASDWIFQKARGHLVCSATNEEQATLALAKEELARECLVHEPQVRGRASEGSP